jgi:hypothetical protein
MWAIRIECLSLVFFNLLGLLGPVGVVEDWPYFMLARHIELSGIWFDIGFCVVFGSWMCRFVRQRRRYFSYPTALILNGIGILNGIVAPSVILIAACLRIGYWRGWF